MFERFLEFVCRSSHRRPLAWLALAFFLSLPALYEVTTELRVNTDLTRLLPEESPAVRWSDELRDTVGDGGVFSILFQGDDPKVLRRALELTAPEVELLPEVQTVQYRYPVKFLEKYAYLLAPSELLQEMFDLLVQWRSAASPFALDLSKDAKEALPSEEQKRLEETLYLATNLPDIHQSRDGRIVGMLVYPKDAVTNLGKVRDLYEKLEVIASKAGEELGVWHGVSGTMRNKLTIFKLVMRDLGRSGIVAIPAILLALVITFWSVRILPVLLWPLGVGLLWAFALVPSLVGDLNSITAFLLMILFGMGVDHSIHLVKRFQGELMVLDPESALLETYRSTGRSVATSGLTSALALTILSLTGFRGFSDFGIISGSAMLVVLVAMFLVMPSALALGVRWGLVLPRSPVMHKWSVVPNQWWTLALAAVVVAAFLASPWGLRFDYDFQELQTETAEAAQVKTLHRQVYSASLTPAAIYVAKDIDALDRMLAALEEAKSHEPGSKLFGRLASIRELSPRPAEVQKRREILTELQDRLKGRWIRRVKDERKKELLQKVRDFQIPWAMPSLKDLPAQAEHVLKARDGSGELVLGVYPIIERRKGKKAIAFTRALYELGRPAGIRGPTGETIIFAEILGLVTREGPWIMVLTLLGVWLLVLVDRRSWWQSLWVLFPLGAGLGLTVGAMFLFGWKLNFFNMVVLPALMGMGVDHGVHYLRRWHELGRDTEATQRELFEALSSASLTSMMGYAGLLLAHHQGLRSIGNLAVMGLFFCWLTALVLLPGCLRLVERRGRPGAMRGMAPPRLARPEKRGAAPLHISAA